MDEQAATCAASNGDGWKEHSAQAPQGPLMTFFEEAIDLEAALVTLKEILCGLERIDREGQTAAQKENTGNALRFSSIYRGLLGWRKAVWVFCGALLSKDVHRVERCAGKDVHRKASAAERRASWEKKEVALRGMVTELQKETQRALNELYTGSGFPDRYRTLPALVSFYEYFLVGRCNTLSGGEGAFSVFDAEVRAGTVAAQADEAWARREVIRRKHPVLYQRLMQVHETAWRVTQEAAEACDGEDLAQLDAWSAFARRVHQAEVWQKTAEND